MKVDFFFAWSKNEEDNLKSWGGGFKLPAFLKIFTAFFNKEE
ncbi:hypothetical protein [Fuchsiella alkaliacetigena]|nr:hypothetical protein [Fuchsiella alkaliacetigena]